MKIKNLIWNIKNLIRWIPVLWNNKHWDYTFLYEVIAFKLTLMIENYERWWSIEEDQRKSTMIKARNTLQEFVDMEGFLIDDSEEINKLKEAFEIIRDHSTSWWD